MNNSDIVRIENKIIKKGTYVIRWNVTRVCNYNCDFCIQGNKEQHIKDSKNESLDLRNNILDKIILYIENNLNSKYDILHFYLIGGEVTILKDIFNIMNKLINCKFDGLIKFNITTNMSADKKILKQFVKMFKKLKNREINFSCSYYKAYTNEKEFINKVKILNNKQNIKTTINIPLIEDIDYDLYLDFKNKYSKNFKVEFVPIRNYKKSISDKVKNELNKNPSNRIMVVTKDGKAHYFSKTNIFSMSINKTHNFNPSGFICDAGINSIAISNIGDVYRCNENINTKLGNILNDNICKITKKFICNAKSCNCSTLYKVIEKK